MCFTMLFTIGHSTHTCEKFIDLLKSQEINCVIDVRSSPFSKIAPQFNKPVLNNVLQKSEILYAHLPEEFGARRTEKMFLDEDGKINFEKVHQSDGFKRGIERVVNGLQKGFKISLMCAEANPFDCHRFSMIARGFSKEGVEVQHILKDGRLVSNLQLEAQLLKRYNAKLPKASLFLTEVSVKEKLEAAYRFRNKDIAFSAIHTDAVV
jgi:uncharacterized protein (DUF488 family)